MACGTTSPPCATRTNKQLRLYIDGNLAGEAQDLTRSLNSKPGDDKARTKIWLGNHLEVFYPVKFDEVRFWNKALTRRGGLGEHDDVWRSIHTENWL